MNEELKSKAEGLAREIAQVVGGIVKVCRLDVEVRLEHGVHVRIIEQQKGSTWNRKPSGKLRAKIYAGGQVVKQYPRRVDGTFNIEGIAEVLRRNVELGGARRASRVAQDGAASVVRATLDSLGIDKFHSDYRVVKSSKPIVRVSINVDVSTSDGIEALKALIAMNANVK